MKALRVLAWIVFVACCCQEARAQSRYATDQIDLSRTTFELTDAAGTQAVFVWVSEWSEATVTLNSSKQAYFKWYFPDGRVGYMYNGSILRYAPLSGYAMSNGANGLEDVNRFAHQPLSQLNAPTRVELVLADVADYSAPYPTGVVIDSACFRAAGPIQLFTKYRFDREACQSTAPSSVSGDVRLGRGPWLLDGPLIRDITVTLTPRDQPENALRWYQLEAINGRFEFTNMPVGLYDIKAEITYEVHLAAQAAPSECWPLLGTHPGGIRVGKSTVTLAEAVDVAAGTSRVVHLEAPPPIVFVHGIESSAGKWLSWSDASMRQGHLAIPVNYNAVIEGNDWITPATTVEQTIIEHLRGFSSFAWSGAYPEWALVGHSQGGLIARVLTRPEPSDEGPSARSPLLEALKLIFILGTPNLGAQKRLVYAQAAPGVKGCYDYLSPARMAKDFQPHFPSFGDKQSNVYAVAGTKDLVCFGRLDCLPGDDDGVVETKSVFCSDKRATCTIQRENRRLTYFNHLELGGKASLGVLTDFVLPLLKK